MRSEPPPIYLINLDRSSERLSRFRERNAHLTNVTRFPAVDGSTLDKGALEKSGYIASDLSNGAGLMDGSLGCALSHVRLWEMAVRRNEPITVFEDDAAVSHQFEKTASDVLAAMPADWDIIMWGANLPPAFIWVDFGVSKVRLSSYGPERYRGAEGVKRFQMEEFWAGPVRLLHSFGLCGYSISASGARAAIEHCLPLGNRLIDFPDAAVRVWTTTSDIALCGLYPFLKAFICLPPLVIVSNDEFSVRTQIDGENRMP